MKLMATRKYLVAAIVILNGCVSLPSHQRQVQDAYIRGLQKARKVAYLRHCSDAVEGINKILAREEKHP
jgi:starvation-inducible outer membrane lipoprotein